jgi:hypothetical protein
VLAAYFLARFHQLSSSLARCSLEQDFCVVVYYETANRENLRKLRGETQNKRNLLQSTDLSSVVVFFPVSSDKVVVLQVTGKGFKAILAEDQHNNG